MLLRDWDSTDGDPAMHFWCSHNGASRRDVSGIPANPFHPAKLLPAFLHVPNSVVTTNDRGSKFCEAQRSAGCGSKDVSRQGITCYDYWRVQPLQLLMPLQLRRAKLPRKYFARKLHDCSDILLLHFLTQLQPRNAMTSWRRLKISSPFFL